MRMNKEEIKFNIINAIEFPINVENCSATKVLGSDYCKEEVYQKLFSIEEFFKDEPSLLEEVNVITDKKKFEPLVVQNKGENETKPSIEEPPELELKSLSHHLQYAFLGENDTVPIIIST